MIFKFNHIILSTLYLVFSPLILADETYVIAPDDPLLLIGSDRLDPILRALRTKDNVELLVGSGAPLNPEGTLVNYVIVETFPREYRFVRSVMVKYNAEGVVEDVTFTPATETWMFSPKACARYLANQVPITVEAMNKLNDATFQGVLDAQQKEPEKSPTKGE